MIQKTPMWTLDEGVAMVRLVQKASRRFSMHVAIGGGVVNEGRSFKDLDLYFLPMDADTTNQEGMRDFLDTLWGAGENIIEGDYPPGPDYTHKLKYTVGDKRIDVFIMRGEMTEITFEPFPKIGRLTRECIITEKIDGTNAQVIITDDGRIAAGSRTRLITPEDDNYGFARWVQENRGALLQLGPGRHFGEWWGGKIQRGYGLTEKRFSLFNTSRWLDTHHHIGDPLEPVGKLQWAPPCCHVVPVLFQGMFSDRVVDNMVNLLRERGSHAAPGFMQPEGIVAYHVATGVLFKKTLEKDEAPKGRG